MKMDIEMIGEIKAAQEIIHGRIETVDMAAATEVHTKEFTQMIKDPRNID